MTDSTKTQQTLERVISDALDSHIPGLRYDLVRRLMQELQRVTATTSAASQTEALQVCLDAIHDTTAQAEILGALLEGAARFSSRAAVFVVRGASVVGWQARGFRDNEALKNFVLDGGHGAAGRATQARTPVTAAAWEFDSRFVAACGAPASGNMLLLPLLVRDKVAALIYADGGADAGGVLDSAALHVLVQATGLWLELLALRRSSGAGVGFRTASEPPAREPLPVPVMAAASAAASYSPPTPLPVPAPDVVAEPPAPGPPDDAEVHNRARRFAKLLVEEIKLYNQAKLSEGRSRRDIYHRLKDEIEKSRAAYDKRYAATVAASADYFAQELVRILADNDTSMMGDSFSR